MLILRCETSGARPAVRPLSALEFCLCLVSCVAAVVVSFDLQGLVQDSGLASKDLKVSHTSSLRLAINDLTIISRLESLAQVRSCRSKLYSCPSVACACVCAADFIS